MEEENNLQGGDMKKAILLATILSLIFGIVQAQTWWLEVDKPLAIQSNVACDSINITVYDSGTIMNEVKSVKYTSANLVSGSEHLYTDSSYTFPSDGWVGPYTVTYNLYADGALKGSAMEVFGGAWYDSMKASGFAVAGNAMTLTTGERSALEDSIYAQRAGYKADVSALMTLAAIDDSSLAKTGDAMTLTTGERASLADSVWNTSEALLLVLFNAPDSSYWFSPDSFVYYYSSSTGKRTYTISNGKVTKWLKE